MKKKVTYTITLFEEDGVNVSKDERELTIKSHPTNSGLVILSYKGHSLALDAEDLLDSVEGVLDLD